MASKSRLDRMVSANRGRSAPKKKITKQYLPPEAAMRSAGSDGSSSGALALSPADAEQYPDEDVEYAPVVQPQPTPDPSLPEDEGYEPEDSVEDGEVGDEAAETAAAQMAVVSEEGAVNVAQPKIAEQERAKFLRPRNAPIRPVSVAPIDDGGSIPGILTLSIPAPIRARYAAAKSRADQPLREYLVERLSRCADHDSESAIYVSDATRREIERVANRNFSSGEELLGWLLTSRHIHMGDVPLSVDQELIDRALYRKSPDQSDAESLSEYLTAGIEIRTGLR